MEKEIRMPDFDDVKAQADALGIAYRSDIKQETLEKKVAAHSEPEVEATATIAVFTNQTTNNIFTSKGRVRPGESVELDAAEAKDCGLE